MSIPISTWLEYNLPPLSYTCGQGNINKKIVNQEWHMWDRSQIFSEVGEQTCHQTCAWLQCNVKIGLGLMASKKSGKIEEKVKAHMKLMLYITNDLCLKWKILRDTS